MNAARAYCQNIEKRYGSCCSRLEDSSFNQNVEEYDDEYYDESDTRPISFEANNSNTQPPNAIGMSMTAVTVVVVCVCRVLRDFFCRSAFVCLCAVFGAFCVCVCCVSCLLKGSAWRVC